MDLHMSRGTLVRVLTGEAAQPEGDAAIRHVRSCKLCQELVAGVSEELRERCALGPLSKPWAALLALLEDEERQALDQLRAEGWWAELSGLAPDEQRAQIKSLPSLQTAEFFEVVIADAALTAQSDPHVGETTAQTARLIADLLPIPPYSEQLKNDFIGRAMLVAGNCRRLAAAWSGSHAALKEARHLLKSGTGDPKLEARLLSVSGSLACDTGDFDGAFRLLGQATDLYRSIEDNVGLASVTVQEAGVLLAACRFEEAMARAREALNLLSPSDVRLEMLARDTITECLIELKQPAQALLSFRATRPLYEKLWSRRNQLRLAYKRARLLDAFGCERESGKAFRRVINGHIEEGLYKSALNITLTFFDSLLKRGALSKAAKLCEQASRLLDSPFCHSQMKQIWEELLAEVRSQAATASRVLEVRLYTMRHWSVPAARLPLKVDAESLAPISVPLVMAELEAATVEPPQIEKIEVTQAGEHHDKSASSSSLFADEGYLRRMERHDRELVAAALTETGGAIRTTARLLGISRNFLRTKIKKFRLEKLVNDAPRPHSKPGPRSRSTR